MKKYILSLLSILLIINHIYSQGYPCLNEVSTNYNAPYALPSALPSNPTPPGQTNFGSRFINQFNWFPIGDDGLFNGYDTYGIINLPSNKMLHIYNSAYGQFYYRLQKEIDMNFLPLPENGWELMSMNLGYYPNILPQRIPVSWSGANGH